MGTGGTISGAGRYLKEQHPNVKVVGVDPIGSLLYDTWRMGRVPDEPFLKTYKIEGIGEDFLPGTTDLSVIDEIVQVGDKESFLMTRRLVREEGIFCGGSSGSAVSGLLKSPIVQSLAADDLVVVILPDSGSRYLSKLFDDEWMREYGFLESAWGEARVGDVLAAKPRHMVIAAAPSDRMREIIERMKIHDISQMPVLSDGKLVGMINESTLLTQMALPGSSPADSIGPIVNRQVTTVAPDLPAEGLMNLFGAGQAVVVVEHDQVIGILTKIDLIEYLAARMK
jgi:cystathionine beta-synthase